VASASEAWGSRGALCTPLRLSAAPRSARSSASPSASYTSTASAEGHSRRSARASVRPATPAPTTATRFGGDEDAHAMTRAAGRRDNVPRPRSAAGAAGASAAIGAQEGDGFFARGTTSVFHAVRTRSRFLCAAARGVIACAHGCCDGTSSLRRAVGGRLCTGAGLIRRSGRRRRARRERRRRRGARLASRALCGAGGRCRHDRRWRCPAGRRGPEQLPASSAGRCQRCRRAGAPRRAGDARAAAAPKPAGARAPPCFAQGARRGPSREGFACAACSATR